jgi:ferredoxin-NADP reductase
MRWLVATVAETIPETARVVTLRLDVPDWPGHRAGQHVDVRLTAEDGYQAQRSYSIASPPDPPGPPGHPGHPGPDRLELTVERIDAGEVSPYLTTVADVGDQVELRGPIGGWFVWDATDPTPLLLVGGGSGVVPLRAILRHHAATASTAAIHLVQSARTLGDVIYRRELEELAGPRRAVTVTLTRESPPGWTGHRGRVDAALLADVGWPPSVRPRCYVCGPTGFVEAVADALVELGHDPQNIRTERFGPTGA